MLLPAAIFLQFMHVAIIFVRLKSISMFHEYFYWLVKIYRDMVAMYVKL